MRAHRRRVGVGFPGPFACCCAKPAGLETVADDLQLFLPETPDLDSPGAVSQIFPAWQNDPGTRLVYDEVYGQRLRTLKRLMECCPSDESKGNSTSIVLSTIQSLLQPIPPASAVRKNTLTVRKGQQLNADEFIRWMVTHGFHGTSGVELPGEFARRGGIVDVFAPDWEDPVRIEWFDEQVESLRRFEVASQRSIATVDAIDMTILPAGGNDEMRAGGASAHLTDYLPDDAWIVLIEPDQIDHEGSRYLERHDNTVELHGIGSTLSAISKFGHVSVWALATSVEANSCRLATQSVERFSGEISRVKEELESAAENHDVFLVSQTDAESKRLREIFADSLLVQQDRLHHVPGRLNAGFHLLHEGAMLLGGNELFRRAQQPRRKGRKRVGKKIDSFLDLREGDLVVHLVHGIGRYRGLKKLQRENQVEDHLTIEFSGKAKVYVPATKIDLVQKYVGASKTRPRLATIGSLQWQKRRKAAELAVTDMAAELLEVQAQRAARPGITFSCRYRMATRI